MKKIILLLATLGVLTSCASCAAKPAAKEYTSSTFEKVLEDSEKEVTRTEPPTTENNINFITQDPIEYRKIVPGTIYDCKGVPIIYSEFIDQEHYNRTLSPEYSEAFSNVISDISSGLDSQPAYRNVLLSSNPTSKGEQPVGKSIITTYDAKIQKSVFDYCRDMNIDGSCVIMRTDGSLVAEISTPGYDANKYIEALSNGTEYPLKSGSIRNKCSDPRAPGSTMKMISATVALISEIEGDTGEIGVFYDDGCWTTTDSSLQVNDWFYSAENGFSAGFGPATRSINDAFIVSSNVVFAKAFTSLGASNVDAMVKKYFKFGEPIELDFTTINTSNKIGLESEKSLALSSFGQGIATTTPLYLSILTQEVVFGTMVKPFTIKNVCDTYYPENVISPGTTPEAIASTNGITLKNEMLEIAKGLNFSLEGYTLYCKTGTAEVDGHDDTLYIAAYLEANNKNFSPSDVYETYNNYGEQNGSYFILLQVRNPKDVKYPWPNPNSIYASHMGPILNHICYLITSND